MRTAVLNWLFARKHGGTFILRLDDTDRQRSTEEFAEGIREDLRWLGLVWGREERQSSRTARYDEMAEKLKKAGRTLSVLRNGGRARTSPQAPARAR